MTASTRSPAARSTAPTTLSPDALRQGPAQPACPCADQIDQYRQGAGAAGRQGDCHLGRSARVGRQDRKRRASCRSTSHHLSCNILARGKVLYDGHAVAAVAATSPHIAEEALRLIEVEYEVLPPVMSVEDAMKPGRSDPAADAAQQGRRADKQTNVATHMQFKRGDIERRLQAGRLHRRARVQDRDGPSGIYRAAQCGRHL